MYICEKIQLRIWKWGKKWKNWYYWNGPVRKAKNRNRSPSLRNKEKTPTSADGFVIKIDFNLFFNSKETFLMIRCAWLDLKIKMKPLTKKALIVTETHRKILMIMTHCGCIFLYKSEMHNILLYSEIWFGNSLYYDSPILLNQMHIYIYNLGDYFLTALYIGT